MSVTCAKCIYNDVCDNKLLTLTVIEYGECSRFKDKSRYIELPCKVGDTVYLPWKWKDTSGIAILTVERISITEAGQSIRTDFWSDDEDYWLAYNCGVFKFDNIGKTVFLTREEAERSLI